MHVSILVVLYGKGLEQSLTLKSLSENIISFADLYIVNNGPEKITENDLFRSKLESSYASVRVVEHLDNRPLSMLYNDFIGYYPDSDYYVLLDDDSELSSEYIGLLKNPKADLIIPRIINKNDGVCYYPIDNGSVVKCDTSLSFLKVMSIGSGLFISNHLITEMKKFGDIFDERFALYGVDTSFFLRLRRLNNTSIDIRTEAFIFHSLSRVDEKKSKFRQTERLYDLAITSRHYPEYISFFDFTKKMIKLTFVFNFNSVFIALKIYALGRHPRIGL